MVGATTKPVTQVEVVAVNSASIKGVALPLAEQIGRQSKAVPTSIAPKKLNSIICVVEIVNLFFIIISHILLISGIMIIIALSYKICNKHVYMIPLIT